MSVVKEYFYNCQCDRCGEICNQELWRVDEDWAREDISENGWTEIQDENGTYKHYCPDCYYIDDEDNVVVKPSVKQE